MVGHEITNSAGSCAIHSCAKCSDAIFGITNFDGVLGKGNITDAGEASLTAMSGHQTKRDGVDSAHGGGYSRV